MYSRIYFSLSFLLFIPLLGHASLQPDDKLLSSLSLHPIWHKLIYFSDQRTEIQTSSFYLSGKENFSAKEELLATIKEMQQPIKGDVNDHAQCKFRARYYWLLSMGVWHDVKLKEVKCPAYEKWSNEANVDSVSVVLASGYLSNPASFFGHMLLKFNSKNENERTDLLDTSINYGAIIPPKENGLVYIAKGLFGGYSAGFTPGVYYENEHNYTNTDLRDVWEYRLNLSRFETHFLLARSWELLKNEFSYFYLTKNCAYRIAEVIELVLDKPLFNKKQPWVIPVEIFRNMDSYNHNGNKLVKEVRHHFSKQNTFYNKLNQLSELEKKLLRELIEDKQFIKNSMYTNFSPDSKVRVIDVLIDYYELMIVKYPDDIYFKEGKRQYLQEMLLLTANQSVFSWDMPKVQPPHYSQRPSLIRLGALHSTNKNDGFLIKLRPAYFDLLTPEVGIIPYATLEGMNIELESFDDSSIKLRKLDVFNIETLGLPSSGLGDDNALAWNISFGLDRPDLSCENCLTPSVEGGFGQAKSFNSSLTVYSYLQMRLQEDVAGYNSFAGGIKTGLLWEVNSSWKMQFLHEFKDYLGESRKPEDYFKIESRFGRSIDWDIRVLYEKQEEERMAVSLGLYF